MLHFFKDCLLPMHGQRQRFRVSWTVWIGWKQEASQGNEYTPENFWLEHNKWRIGSDDFPLKTWVIFRFQPLIFQDVGVSKNRGTPKSSNFNRDFHYKPSILGYHYFRKPPCSFLLVIQDLEIAGLFQSWSWNKLLPEKKGCLIYPKLTNVTSWK